MTDSSKLKGYAPTIVIHGPDDTSGNTVTRVNAPGAESVAQISPAGQISLTVRGTQDVGTSGETRVAQTICARLRAEDIQAEFLAAPDDRGEDRRIKTVERNLNLQVVTVPLDHAFWGSASRSSAFTSVPLEGAAQWLHESITKKVKKSTVSDRKETVLALDAQHANVLTEQGVIDSYLRAHGDPRSCFALRVS